MLQLTSLLKNRLTGEIATRNQLQNKLSHEQDEVLELQKKITCSAELYARLLQEEENREADLSVTWYAPHDLALTGLQLSIQQAEKKLEEAAYAYEVLSCPRTWDKCKECMTCRCWRV